MRILRPLPARDPQEMPRDAARLDLFFDLVSAIAVASAAAGFHQAINGGHGLAMLPVFICVFVAAWWAWMNHAWFASAYDNGDPLFKLLTLVIMAGNLLFAAGVQHIFEMLDLTLAMLGWTIMRAGMAMQWLRAALNGGKLSRPAWRYFCGILLALALWLLLYLNVPVTSSAFLPLAGLILLAEFMVPAVAGRAARAPWHRPHIMARYGHWNTIILALVILSAALALANLYEENAAIGILATAASGFVITAALWWLYAAGQAQFAAVPPKRAAFWSAGQIAVFFAGALLAAGIAAVMEVQANSSSIRIEQASVYVSAAAMLYLLSLWAVRDLHLRLGKRSLALPATAAALAWAAYAGAAPWYAAAICVAALIWRVPLRAG